MNSQFTVAIKFGVIRVAAVYSVAVFTVVCGAVQIQAAACFGIPLVSVLVFILLAWVRGHLYFFLNLPITRLWSLQSCLQLSLT